MPQVNSRFVTRRPWEEVNDADKQEVIRALALGYSVRQASKIVRRAPAQIFEWARTDTGFAAALNAIAADKDDEVVEFRERVRRTAATMLDHLLDLADAKHPVRERNAAVKTFFADVHQPVLLPRTPSGPQAPTVLVHAQQAAFLVGQPSNGAANGASHAEDPRHAQSDSPPQAPSPPPFVEGGRPTTSNLSAGGSLVSPTQLIEATLERSVPGTRLSAFDVGDADEGDAT